jgi:membrane-associated phospholipid phosphatase
MISIDGEIPYWAWTWVFYYSGYLYSILWAGMLVWRLPSNSFIRVFWAYLWMILIGAILHWFIPTQPPWPDQIGTVQGWVKETTGMLPFACFPSMHVALAVFPACIGLFVLKSRTVKVLSVIAAILISISTISAKEHYVLDLLGGVILAAPACLYWRIGMPHHMKRRG